MSHKGKRSSKKSKIEPQPERLLYVLEARNSTNDWYPLIGMEYCAHGSQEEANEALEEQLGDTCRGCPCVDHQGQEQLRVAVYKRVD